MCAPERIGLARADDSSCRGQIFCEKETSPSTLGYLRK